MGDVSSCRANVEKSFVRLSLLLLAFTLRHETSDRHRLILIWYRSLDNDDEHESSAILYALYSGRSSSQIHHKRLKIICERSVRHHLDGVALCHSRFIHSDSRGHARRSTDDCCSDGRNENEGSRRRGRLTSGRRWNRSTITFVQRDEDPDESLRTCHFLLRCIVYTSG